jgi:hypothetical protein
VRKQQGGVDDARVHQPQRAQIVLLAHRAAYSDES